MRISSSVLTALAILLAVVLVLPGCGGKQGPASRVTTIDFWHTQTGANEKALQALVDEYNRANTNHVLVKLTRQGTYTDLNRKTMAAIEAHAPPNLAVAYESMVADYMTAKALLPLDPLVNGANGLSKADLDDIFPVYLAMNRFPTFGNQLLSFPFTKSLDVMYYNQAALKDSGIASPPRTWADFKRAVLTTARKDSTGKTTRYGLDVDLDASTLDAWLYSNGVSLLTPDNRKVAFDTPGGVEVLTTLKDIFTAGAGLQNPPQSFDYQVQFGAGKAVLFCGSSTGRNFFRTAVAGKFPWSIASIPQKDPAHPVTVLYGGNVCIFRSTPEKEAASWDFLKWLTARDQVVFWATHSTYMPIRKSVAAMPQMKAAWKQDPQGYECFKLIPTGKPEPYVRGWQDIRHIMTDAVQAVISARSTPAAALSDAANKANAVLARYR